MNYTQRMVFFLRLITAAVVWLVTFFGIIHLWKMFDHRFGEDFSFWSLSTATVTSIYFSVVLMPLQSKKFAMFVFSLFSMSAVMAAYIGESALHRAVFTSFDNLYAIFGCIFGIAITLYYLIYSKAGYNRIK